MDTEPTDAATPSDPDAATPADPGPAAPATPTAAPADPGPAAPTEDELVDRARAWIAGDPDPDTRAELQALVDAGDVDELAERVGAQLEFGTAGLRGVVGAGPNRMNRAVVIRTTRGLADHLLATDPRAAERGVVLAFDARHSSAEFAEAAVSVLAGAGIRARWYDTYQPTPLVPFTQAHLDAAAGVVVTASHNPPEYNGYKVYAEGAAQIVPPTDVAIARAIEAVGPAAEVPLADPATSELVEVLGDAEMDAYLAALKQARTHVDGPDLTIAYTPLHGVGRDLMLRAMADGGYHHVHTVVEQAEPDGAFSTVNFPNPEEPGAMDLVIDLATRIDADLVIAHDPDADRLATAVPDPAGGFRMLSGNQIGVLLADHLLRGSTVDRPLVVASIVSSPMLRSIGDAYGAHTEYTLTGFKWISAAARELEAQGHRFVYGFEEALGSSVGTVVRDKDGIGAGVVFADLVRELAAHDRTVLDRLHELAQAHGLWVSQQLAVTRPGTQGRVEIAAAMASLDGRVPEAFAGHEVRNSTDYRVGAEHRPPWLTTHDLVEFELADGRAMIRPSGTEPKCKIYVDLRTELGPEDDLDARSAELEAEAAAVAADLAAYVGLT